jgi:predicted dehydrogenase
MSSTAWPTRRSVSLDSNGHSRPSPVSPPATVAVAGAGGFGRFCLEAYRQADDILVAAVADPNLAGSAPRSHPELSITADWRDLLDVPTIEVIHLVTPPLLRAEIAVPALNAGKSVFCEKPLALSLREADEILGAARLAGRAVGVDYVLRHHPAFELVACLAASALFGPLRTFSLQNFAQALPGDHWMWDTEKSGGILVEHGVHFFDAYGQIAGAPEEVWAEAPRKESVEVTVRYVSGSIGRYYHEFAWPQQVERTHGIMFFERGYVEVDGWIPERVHGRLDAPAAALEAFVRPLCPSLEVREDSGAVSFDARFPDRQAAYRSAIVDGMRDLIAKHRAPGHQMVVSANDARDSLSLALGARRAVETGGRERLTR